MVMYLLKVEFVNSTNEPQNSASVLWGKHTTIENSFPKVEDFKTIKDFLCIISTSCRPRDQTTISKFMNVMNSKPDEAIANSQSFAATVFSDTVDGHVRINFKINAVLCAVGSRY